jgi:hypothetical protein
VSRSTIIRAAVAVVAVALCLLLVRVLHAGQESAATTAPAPAASSTTPIAVNPTPPPTPTPTAPTPTPSATATVQPPMTAPVVAEVFVEAWLDTRHGARHDDKAAWLQGMEPCTDPTFLDALATTDLGNVWDAQSQHMPQAVDVPERGTDGQALVRVPTTAGTLAVSLGILDGRWVVTSLDEVQQ